MCQYASVALPVEGWDTYRAQEFSNFFQRYLCFCVFFCSQMASFCETALSHIYRTPPALPHTNTHTHFHDVQKVSLTFRPQGHSQSVRTDLAILASVMRHGFTVKSSAKSQIAAVSHTWGMKAEILPSPILTLWLLVFFFPRSVMLTIHKHCTGQLVWKRLHFGYTIKPFRPGFQDRTQKLNAKSRKLRNIREELTVSLNYRRLPSRHAFGQSRLRFASAEHECS